MTSVLAASADPQNGRGWGPRRTQRERSQALGSPGSGVRVLGADTLELVVS